MNAARLACLAVLAALAVVLAGCAAPPSMHYEVHVRSSVTDPTPVLAALDRWTAATGATFDVTLSDDWLPQGRPGFTVGFYPSADVEAACGVGHAAGCTPGGGVGEGYQSAVMVAGDGPSLAILPHTLAHEFGHAMGLGHVGDPSAVMFPTASPSSGAELSPSDVAEFWTVRR